MKRHSILLLLGLGAGAALLSITGNAQNAPQDPNAGLLQRVEALERELAKTTSQGQGLKDQVKSNAESLDGLVKWIGAQAKSAGQLAGTLDAAEDQGFTAGINFQSRITLLAGWRKALAEAQKGLVAKGGAAEDANAKKGRGRRSGGAK